MKRIICAVIAIAAVCSLLTACDIKIPMIKEETTAESTTETTTLPPDYGAWGKSYSDYLLSIAGGNANLAGYYYEPEDCRFSVVDLNADNIPELLISGGDQEASKVDIHTFNGYETRYIGSAGAAGNMTYVEGAGLIYTYELLENQETHTVSFFDGESIKQVWQGITIASDSSLIPVDCNEDYGDKVEFFTSDSEEPIAQEDYRAAFAQNIPAATVTLGRDGYPLTEENAVALKTGADFIDRSDDTDGREEGGAYPETLPQGDAAAAFKALLTEKILSGLGEDVMFGFMNIDDDGTPELFISQGESEYSAVEIYCFDGESPVLVCTSGSSGKTGVAEGGGIVAGTFKGEGSQSNVVYRLDGGKSTVIWSGETITGEDGAVEYTSDGETVDKDTYSESYNQYYAEGNLTEIGRNAHALTEEEVNGLLN
jgi:hypothetical protein